VLVLGSSCQFLYLILVAQSAENVLDKFAFFGVVSNCFELGIVLVRMT
jgi:hypothetical protein